MGYCSVGIELNLLLMLTQDYVLRLGETAFLHVWINQEIQEKY
jgi:hypothetical protein